MKYLIRILITIFSLCALIVLILVGLYFRAQQLPPKPPRGKVIAKDYSIGKQDGQGETKMTTVEFDGYRFKFPIDYGNLDPNAGIMFTGYWPGFIPASALNQNRSVEERKAQLYDSITVFVDGYCISKPPLTDEQRLENVARIQAHIKQSYFDPVFDPELGLSVYRRRNDNEPVFYTMTNPDVKSQSGTIIGIDCKPHPSIKNDGGVVKTDDSNIYCQSAHVFRPNLCVTVRFYKKNLRDWRAIHAKVLNFIETSMNLAK